MTSEAQSNAPSGILPSPLLAQHSFAAVAYLNMLPFFADDPSIHLFPSPRALNSNQPECQAYCSSLIAGLASNIHPLSNQLGVFSSGAVLSVYLEPFLHAENHRTFWQQLEQLWAHRHPDPRAALKNSDVHGRIRLRSSGASEQSVWMIRVLCALAGFAVDVVAAETSTSAAAKRTSAKMEPEACLWIGDPALDNRLKNPNSYRIDVGQIWNSHLGRKAWFAGWFAGSQNGNQQREKSVAELMTRAMAWTARSEFSRWCTIHRFLQNQESPLLTRYSSRMNEQNHIHDEQYWELRDTLENYFSGLEFILDADEGTQLLEFYLQINNALSDWQSRSGAESTSDGALCLPSDLLFTDFHGNIGQSDSR